MATVTASPPPRAWTTPAETEHNANGDTLRENSNPTDDFTGDLKVSQKPPSRAELESVGDMPVLDADGKTHTFRSLFSSEDQQSRTMIIFIRHFFCGNCQEYLRALCTSITPASVAALTPPTSLKIIGCGDPSLIPFYASTTSCGFPIYADPSKDLFSKLGMARTLDLGPTRPDYMTKSMLRVCFESFVQNVAAGRKALKGGDYWQVGGEFWVLGGGKEVGWCHRMVNTRDHASVEDLRTLMGLDDPAEGPRRGVATALKKRWSVVGDGTGLKHGVSLRDRWRSRSRGRGNEESAVRENKEKAEGKKSEEGTVEEKKDELSRVKDHKADDASTS